MTTVLGMKQDQIVASSVQHTEPLLGDSSQLVQLAYLAARTSAVLRRVGKANALDAIDREVLERSANLLRVAAETTDFVRSGGTTGSRPIAFGFGAVSAALNATVASQPSAEATELLDQLAKALAVEANGELSQMHAQLEQLFNLMADSATRSAGSSGELRPIS